MNRLNEATIGQLIGDVQISGADAAAKAVIEKASKREIANMTLAQLEAYMQQDGDGEIGVNDDNIEGVLELYRQIRSMIDANQRLEALHRNLSQNSEVKEHIMDNFTQLKSMLQSIINGKDEEAAVTMHDYFVSKTREVAGLGASAQIEEDFEELTEEDVEQILESASEEELDEAVRAYYGSGASMRRPRGEQERTILAKTIRSNRAQNRADADKTLRAVHYRDNERFIKNLERGPDETAYAFAQRKNKLLNPDVKNHPLRRTFRKIAGARSAYRDDADVSATDFIKFYKQEMYPHGFKPGVDTLKFSPKVIYKFFGVSGMEELVQKAVQNPSFAETVRNLLDQVSDMAPTDESFGDIVGDILNFGFEVNDKMRAAMKQRG